MNQAKDILLLEDDYDDVLVFEMAIKQLGFSYILRHAEDREVLFVLLKNEVPYILFVDINMPRVNGVSCICEIRKNKEYDNLPIVVYTSNLSDSISDECFRKGANMYIIKTKTFNDLTRKLQKVFEVDWSSYLHYPSQDQFVLS